MKNKKYWALVGVATITILGYLGFMVKHEDALNNMPFHKATIISTGKVVQVVDDQAIVRQTDPKTGETVEIIDLPKGASVQTGQKITVIVQPTDS